MIPARIAAAGWSASRRAARSTASRQGLGQADGAALIAAARAGDQPARTALERPAGQLGLALAGAVALLDPEAIVVSGGIADALDMLGPSILAAMRRQLPAHLRDIGHQAGRVRPARGIGRRGAGRRGRSGMEADTMSEATYPQPDRRRPEPLWYQVEQAIRTIVKGGEWATGAQIPAEDRLCSMFGVSRITLRHALRNLEEHGLLRREHGRGTFVRSTTLVAGTRELTSFTQEMGHLGLVVGSRLLDCSLTTANAATAAALEIDEGDPVVRIRRLRLGNDAPIGIQTAQLSTARVPGFLDSGCRKARSTKRWKSATASCRVEAREVYRVAAVGAEDAALLDLAEGSPAFVVERITTDERGPFEFTVSIMRGDRYEIRSTLAPAARPPTTAFDATSPSQQEYHPCPTSTSPVSPHLSRKRPKTNADAFDQAAGRFADSLAGWRAGPSLRLRPFGAAMPGDVPALRHLCRLQPAHRPARDVAQRARRRRRARAALARADRELCGKVPRPSAAEQGRLDHHLRP